MRADAIGLFWQDLPKVKEAKEKPLKVKMLPPPLSVSVLDTPKQVKQYKFDDRKQALMDIESYSNYFLVLFRRLPDNKLLGFEMKQGEVLDIAGIKKVLEEYEIITFNGIKYDIPILNLALNGADCQTLKHVTNLIVNQNMRSYQVEREYKLPALRINHIDVAEVAPGVAIGMKLYGARLNCHHLQDLPYPENMELNNEQMKDVRAYCGHDLEALYLLFRELQEQIALRRNMSNRYNMDLRSKSDAQIAEEIIKVEMQKKTKRIPSKPSIVTKEFCYVVPEFISFQTEQLQQALETVRTSPFVIDHSGYSALPKEISKLRLPIGNSIYQMGMGGLHSNESSVYHISDSRYIIRDCDVTSYYPQIILNCELYPERLGRPFLEVYREIVNERLAAKKSGDKVKAESLKITVNGSFGKLGSPHSTLYAPELMVQVTLTGQLSLLMLIESLELEDISVISGNTDGIVIKCPVKLEKRCDEIIADWETKTGFSMEHTQYAGIYSRDVNNYIAIKYDGSVKTKGCFSPGSMAKNPTTEIVNEAMIQYLKYGTAFEDTIHACTDIRKFLGVRSVKGGAQYKDQFLGRVVRWYYAKNCKDSINYRTNGNQVAKTMGAKPLMVLPDSIPEDIDYNWYIQECYQLF